MPLSGRAHDLGPPASGASAGDIADPGSDEARFASYSTRREARILEELMARHAARAHAQARRLLGSGTDAEDAVQEAMIRLVRTAHRYDARVPFSAWLARLVHASALSYRRSRLRRGRRERVAGAAALERARAATPEAAGLDHAERVRAAVLALGERDRAAIDYAYFSGLDQRAAAAAMGIRVEALGMRLTRARARLRQMLQRGGMIGAGTAEAALLSLTALSQPPAEEVERMMAGLVARLARGGLTPATGLGWQGIPIVAWLAAGLVALAIIVPTLIGAHGGRTRLATVPARPAPAAPAVAAKASAADAAIERLDHALIGGGERRSMGPPLFSPDHRVMALRLHGENEAVAFYDTASLLLAGGPPRAIAEFPVAPLPPSGLGRMPYDAFGIGVSFALDSPTCLIQGPHGLQRWSWSRPQDPPSELGCHLPGWSLYCNSRDGEEWHLIGRLNGDHTLQLFECHIGSGRALATQSSAIQLSGDILAPETPADAVMWTNPSGALFQSALPPGWSAQPQRVTWSNAAGAHTSTIGGVPPSIDPLTVGRAIGRHVETLSAMMTWTMALRQSENTRCLYRVLADARLAPAERSQALPAEAPIPPDHGQDLDGVEPRPPPVRAIVNVEVGGDITLLQTISLARAMDRAIILATGQGQITTLELAHVIDRSGSSAVNRTQVWLRTHDPGWSREPVRPAAPRDRLIGDRIFAEADAQAPLTGAAPRALLVQVAVAPDATAAILLSLERIGGQARFSFWRLDARHDSLVRLGAPIFPHTALPAAFLEQSLISIDEDARVIAIALYAEGEPPVSQGVLLLPLPESGF